MMRYFKEIYSSSVLNVTIQKCCDCESIWY